MQLENDVSQVKFPTPCFLEWKINHFLSHVGLTELGPGVAGSQQNEELSEVSFQVVKGGD